MDSNTRTTVTDNALIMAKGINQAVAMLDTELGSQKAVPKLRSGFF